MMIYPYIQITLYSFDIQTPLLSPHGGGGGTRNTGIMDGDFY